MKVLHLTASDQGGAGIAAKRIHLGLLKNGVNSKLLTLHSSSPGKEGVYCFHRSIGNRLFNRLLDLSSNFISNDFQFLNKARNIQGNFEIFTSPLTNYKVEDHPLVDEADIIHLHWVSDFINYKTFFKKLGKSKKIVWTIHDMNPFMGGFHYQGDFDSNPQTHEVEKYFQKIKAFALNDLSSDQMHIIFLNHWMKNASERAGVLNRFQSSIIPNGLDIHSLSGPNKITSRNSLKINQNEKVIMFGCQSIKVRRKGFDLLQEALKKLTEKTTERITLLTIGDSLPEINLKSNISVINLGFIKDRTLIQTAYSASDVFLLPSREDNLPNMMIEAWACGTPVISFTEGGMKDYIINGKNGLLVQDLSTTELANAIMNALTQIKFDPDFCISHAFNNFDLDLICNRIQQEVYQNF